MGKSNANECNESSLSNCRVQLALSTKKDGMILEFLIIRTKVKPMNIIKTDIDGVLIIEPRLFRDARGYFFESFSEREFEEKVSPILGHSVHFCQDNESMSSYGVMRGLHFLDSILLSNINKGLVSYLIFILSQLYNVK